METQDLSSPKVPINTICLSVLTVIAVGFVLREMRTVFLPLVVAVMFAFLMQPAIQRLQRAKVPRAAAIFIMTAVSLVALFAMAWILYISLGKFVHSFSEFVPQINGIIDSLAVLLKIPNRLREGFSAGKWIDEHMHQLSAMIFRFSASGFRFFSGLFFIYLMGIFLLIEFKNFKHKFSASLEPSVGRRVVDIAAHISNQISHYLAVKAFVSALTGIATFFILFSVNIKFSGMWGIMAFLLNFIPTVGSAVAIAVCVLLPFIQFYLAPIPIIVTCIGIPLVHTVFGIILEPRLQGARLDISPFFVVISLTAWGWIWGVPGMFISVPITVCLKIILSNFGPYAIISKIISVGAPAKLKK